MARAKTSFIRWLLIGLVVLAVLVTAAYGLWQLSRSRDYQLFGKLVSHVETTDKVVALTFDDGPTAKYAPEVLALLREKAVKATFFVTGQEAEENAALAQAMVADGHELGNHTWTHSDMTLASPEKAASEVERTDAVIRAAGHQGEIYFRPPFGKKLFGLPLYLSRHGRTTVTWDVEPESFAEVASSSERITQHVLDRVQPGSIVILHVMYPSRETSRQALPGIIDGLRERGFRMVTVSELLRSE